MRGVSSSDDLTSSGASCMITGCSSGLETFQLETYNVMVCGSVERSTRAAES